jgi:hypothetical protein
MKDPLLGLAYDEIQSAPYEGDHHWVRIEIEGIQTSLSAQQAIDWIRRKERARLAKGQPWPARQKGLQEPYTETEIPLSVPEQESQIQ